MAITDYVTVNVLLEGAAPPAAGFGSPCFVNANSVDSDRLQGPYASLADIVDAGFATSDAFYLWASAVLSQRPRPSRVYSGRIDAADASLQASLAAIVAAGPGDFYAFNLASNLADDIVGLAAYVETLQKIAIVQSSSAAMLAGTAESAQTMTITVGGTPADGDYTVTVRNPRTGAIVADSTVTRDAGSPATNDDIAAALDTALAADLEAAIAAVSVSANVVTIAFTATYAGIDFESSTSTSAPGTGTLTSAVSVAAVQNPGAALSTAGYHRTALWYHDDDTEYLDGAISGRCLAFDLDAEKGAGTWHGKSLSGISGANLTTAQRAQLRAYNANMYAPVVFSSGVEQPAFSSFGTMASGRYIDVQTTMDWVHARSEEALLGVTLRTPTKNPYTDAGMAIYQAAVLGVLERGGRALHFANGEVSPVTGRRTPWVDVPRAADVSAADKQARRLRLTGEVILAGAIHTVVNFTLYVNF